MKMEDPMGYLRQLLAQNGASSLELQRECGVPGSIIRNVRNGSVREVYVTNWAKLVNHLEAAQG